MVRSIGGGLKGHVITQHKLRVTIEQPRFSTSTVIEGDKNPYSVWPAQCTDDPDGLIAEIRIDFLPQNMRFFIGLL